MARNVLSVGIRKHAWKEGDVKRLGGRRGYTFVELLTVVAIMVILAGLAITMLSKSSKITQEEADKALLAKLQLAVELYTDHYGCTPPPCYYRWTDEGGSSIWARQGFNWAKALTNGFMAADEANWDGTQLVSADGTKVKYEVRGRKKHVGSAEVKFVVGTLTNKFVVEVRD